jgi:tRNA-specific 2-thiouridylase
MRIIVAMSGGVDSSVVAALLQRQGHEVVGVTLQLYDHGGATSRRGACCAGQDIHDARRVADHLAIPHYVLDYEARFAAAVIDAFAASYAAGETPIPCVTCNQKLKFGDLLATAKELGGEYLATGHYIQLRDGPGGRELYRARDADRDQSYFLFATRREDLGSLIFPLGGYRKSGVRRLAHAFALPVADKPDSQDICFVPQGRYSALVERLKPDAAAPGEIVHVDGRVLGGHAGIINYTVGQRRGLGLASEGPLYVVRLEPEARRVVVGPRAAIVTRRIRLRAVNWLGDAPIPPEGLSLAIQVRSTARPQWARVIADCEGGWVTLADGEYGVSAGQACVFYADTSPEARVLGGGFIARACAEGAVVRASATVRSERVYAPYAS